MDSEDFKPSEDYKPYEAKPYEANGGATVECDTSTDEGKGVGIDLRSIINPWAWFHPEQLDPRVVDLIYYRNVKATGAVFGGSVVILISLAYLSLISVVSYMSLALLTGTIVFRVYKNIMQAVQKSQDGHPFKNYLEMDTDVPQDKAYEFADVFIGQANATINELKRLFLVEDLVDSVKFGCLLWCLTYVGAWFNGLTLIILAVVALFTLPKLYELNKTQVDNYLGVAKTQVNDVMAKGVTTLQEKAVWGKEYLQESAIRVKAALPIGNKEKSQ